MRSVFFIDGEGTVRAVISYPPEVGRSFSEIKRVIEALQVVDRHGVSCPANWTRGEAVIVPPPKTTADAKQRSQDDELDSKDWYLSHKKIED